MVQQQPKKTIDLALQGGGSHGALTWGVLDRILEDERLEIAGISGTSAGAMNAVVLAQGFQERGREGAR
jgi:NTE family protein